MAIFDDASRRAFLADILGSRMPDQAQGWMGGFPGSLPPALPARVPSLPVQATAVPGAVPGAFPGQANGGVFPGQANAGVFPGGGRPTAFPGQMPTLPAQASQTAQNRIASVFGNTPGQAGPANPVVQNQPPTRQASPRAGGFMPRLPTPGGMRPGR